MNPAFPVSPCSNPHLVVKGVTAGWTAVNCTVGSDSLWPMDCNKPGLPVPHHLPKFAQVRVHCINDAIQPPHPLTPSSPSALNLSQHQGLFQWTSCLHQMTSILEFQLQHQSSQPYSGLISLTTDCFDFTAVQRTLRSLLQHHSSKASILWHSAFFKVQLSQLYSWTVLGCKLACCWSTSKNNFLCLSKLTRHWIY